ncbi:Hsp70 protein [Bifidobacterium italicum]|uniref:Hsp70 protein n=1 Tax=Bifidobacterium italicum TaxID=1960968 RepID=A0A2A2EFS6_9BIFI|nr:Hsp70 family protein [Bifidobacterium italicum]PAU67840.1 Hsp70 protein [Bifidobacterium italicum]
MQLGIHFGVDESESAVMVNGVPVHMLPPGRGPVPSLVHYCEHRNPQWHVGYDVTESDCRDGDGLVRDVRLRLNHDVPVGSKQFSSYQLAAMIINHIIEVAEEQAGRKGLDGSVDVLVVGVPAHCNERQLNLLQKAISDASGIDCSNIYWIKESVSSALYMCEQGIVREGSKTILVFDVRKRATECSIVRKGDGDADLYVEEKTEALLCAERNFVDAANRLVVHNAKEQENLDLKNNTYSRIIEWGEQLVSQVTYNEDAVVLVQHEGLQYIIKATRREFEERVKPLLDLMLDFMDRMLSQYGHVDEIICVGSSSCMPMVANGIRARHPDTPVGVKNPRLAVAYGAAIYARSKFEEMRLAATGNEEPDWSKLGSELTWDRMRCTVRQTWLSPQECFYTLKSSRKNGDSNHGERMEVYSLVDGEPWEHEERTAYVVGVANPGIVYVLEHASDSIIPDDVPKRMKELLLSWTVALYVKSCMYKADFEAKMRELGDQSDYRRVIMRLFSDANRFAASHAAEQSGNGEVDWDARHVFLISDRPSLGDDDAEFLGIVHASQRDLMAQTDATPMLSVRGRDLLRKIRDASLIMPTHAEPMPVPTTGRQAGTVSEVVPPKSPLYNDGRTWSGTPGNGLCPCGSGEKYKNCHKRNEKE